eukprot:scaffold218170_cov15-Tisochrysis_lutea.AAC.1
MPCSIDEIKCWPVGVVGLFTLLTPLATSATKGLVRSSLPNLHESSLPILYNARTSLPLEDVKLATTLEGKKYAGKGNYPYLK